MNGTLGELPSGDSLTTVIKSTVITLPVPADGAGHAVVSVVLTPGAWRLTCDIFYNGSNTDYFDYMISATSGELIPSLSGLGLAQRSAVGSIGYASGTLSGADVTTVSNTIYYLNVGVQTSAASINANLRAERIC